MESKTLHVIMEFSVALSEVHTSVALLNIKIGKHSTATYFAFQERRLPVLEKAVVSHHGFPSECSVLRQEENRYVFFVFLTCNCYLIIVPSEIS